MTIRDQDIDALRDHLKKSGFEEPHDDWLSDRVLSLFVEYELHLKREDTQTLATRVTTSKRLMDSVWDTAQVLEQWADDLTTPEIADDSPIVKHDPWGDIPRPVIEGDLALHLVDGEFSDEEVETAQRVLGALFRRTEAMHHAHLGRYNDRPIRNERPEIGAVIRGFIRLWCQAMNIPEREIVISSSAGSPAMNFIEAGSAMILPRSPQRETIERYVIQHRRMVN